MDKALTPCDPLAVLLAAPCALISEGSQKEILVAGYSTIVVRVYTTLKCLCSVHSCFYSTTQSLVHLCLTCIQQVGEMTWMCDLLLLQTPFYQQINSSSLCWT